MSFSKTNPHTPLFTWIFRAILFFSLIYPQHSNARPADDFIKELDQYIETTRKTWGVPGMAAAVVKDNKILLLKGYGVRDLTTNKPVDTHTIFQWASLSKTVAATLTGVAVEKKQLSLNTPIIKYLPKLLLGTPEQTAQITLRHVLSHTTGFPSHSGDVKLEGGEGFDTIIKSFEKLRILNAPGLVYAYQNVIYSLSGKVLEKTLHMPYSDAVSQYLFEPLHMNDASLGLDGFESATNRATPYRYSNAEHHQVAYSKNYYHVLPAAGVNASISDAAAWLRFQLSAYTENSEDEPVIVSKKILESLHKPIAASPQETRRMRRYPDRVSKTFYGLGWRIYDYSGEDIICHGGMVNGFKSLLSFSPQHKTGIVLLSHSTSPAIGLIRSYFFDQLFDLNFIDWNKDLKDQEILAMEKQKQKKALRKKKGTKKQTRKK